MINKEFFPFELNLLENEKTYNLMNTAGAQGVGIFILLLTEIRKQEGYRIGKQTLLRIARNTGITPEEVEHVVTNYGLFNLEEEDGEVRISSPYIDRVMENLEEKRRKLSEAGKKGAQAKSKKNSQSKPHLSHPSAEEYSIKENKLKETSPATSAINSSKQEKGEEDTSESSSNSSSSKALWEQHIDRSIQEDSWIELQATNSGMGSTFVKWKTDIAELFKSHVRTQGTEWRITSQGDAKSYFSNFIRQGTPTNERVIQSLKKIIEIKEPYRFESIDPETGQRSYFGLKIPTDAPPRPNLTAMWDEYHKKWI